MPIDWLATGLMVAGNALVSMTQPRPRKPEQTAQDKVISDALTQARAIRKRNEAGAAMYKALTGRTVQEAGIAKPTPTAWEVYQRNAAEMDAYAQQREAAEQPLQKTEGVSKSAKSDVYSASADAPVLKETVTQQTVYDTKQDEEDKLKPATTRMG